jgi:hypothetical protein
VFPGRGPQGSEKEKWLQEKGVWTIVCLHKILLVNRSLKRIIMKPDSDKGITRVISRLPEGSGTRIFDQWTAA